MLKQMCILLQSPVQERELTLSVPFRGGAADEEDGTKRVSIRFKAHSSSLHTSRSRAVRNELNRLSHAQHTVTVRFGGAEPDLTIKLKYSTQMAKLYAVRSSGAYLSRRR